MQFLLLYYRALIFLSIWQCMYNSSIVCYVTAVTSIAYWWQPSTFLAVKRCSMIFFSEGWECWLNHFRVKFPKYLHSSPYVLGENMKIIFSIKLFALWYLNFVSPWYIFIRLERKLLIILYHETRAFFYNWPIYTLMQLLQLLDHLRRGSAWNACWDLTLLSKHAATMFPFRCYFKR
jgi:hypothetical protein